MQTFLPYKDFVKTAQCLDYRRLGKQRVEATQIYKIVSGERTTGGWINHPAVLMWKGYVDALAFYQNIMIKEWIQRGYKNNMELLEWQSSFDLPPIVGDTDFHRSHQSNLLRKDAEFYSQYKWNVTDDLPYIWSVDESSRTIQTDSRDSNDRHIE